MCSFMKTGSEFMFGLPTPRTLVVFESVLHCTADYWARLGLRVLAYDLCYTGNSKS
jgi:hypothetical protein